MIVVQPMNGIERVVKKVDQFTVSLRKTKKREVLLKKRMKVDDLPGS
jgi:sRNA-binding regulator protein Hfq